MWEGMGKWMREGREGNAFLYLIPFICLYQISEILLDQFRSLIPQTLVV